MITLRYRVFSIIALVTFLSSVTSQEIQAQVTNMYRGSVKSHSKKPLRLKKWSFEKLPDWWIEVPKEGLPEFGLSNRERVGISPVPTPIPEPVPPHERVGISPIPTPTPRPVPHGERVGISPVPTPIPHPIPEEFGLFDSSSLLDELIDMYTDAVRGGDFGAADLLEELIIIVPNF